MTAAKPLHDFMKYASLSVMAMIAMSCYILADTFFFFFWPWHPGPGCPEPGYSRL